MSESTFDPAILAVADAMTPNAWIAEPDGSREWFNSAWYFYTGLTPDPVLPKFGTAWTGVVHAEDSPAVFVARRTAFETGTTYNVEARLRGAGGKYRRFQLRAVPLYGDAGIVRWLGTCTDIDDRRRAEAQQVVIAQLQERLQFGARAGDVLSESLNVDATLQRLVDLVVPGLADWAGIDLIG